jgi:hypothetical protein
MNKYAPIYLLAFFTFSLNAQDVTSFFSKTDNFLNTYVENGAVAYKKIHSNPSELNEILNMIETLSISRDDDAYKAFWINAYNLAVIKGIINNYPLKSPLDKVGFFDKITYKIAGKKVTLNTIENKLLRAEFKDARLHFVLVCGAKGCPPLIPNAYLPRTVDKQLQEQTELAINGKSFLKINSKKKRVEGSEILKWYKEDFISNGQSEIDFLNSFRNEKIPSNFKLSYSPYNWKLNSQSNNK